MWNWGDWNYPKYQDTTKGCDAWGNLEYDTAQVLALAFAASGKPDLHGAMVAAARHFMDVDTIHFYPYRPSWVGMNHPKNPLHFTFELGGVDLGHTWTEGLISYFFLTGDGRGLEAARGIADYLVGRAHGFVRGNPRQWGWPQIALIAVYDATGDAKYLEAAKQYAAGGMKAHPPTDVNKWKLGILADGLAYTDSVTRDAAIEAWLAKYVDAVTSRKVALDARLFPAVAYMAALRGNAEWKAAALKRAEKLDLGSWGKPFTINGRLGFRIYSLLSGETLDATIQSPTGASRAQEGEESRHCPASLVISPFDPVDRRGLAPCSGPARSAEKRCPGPGSPLRALRDTDGLLAVALSPQEDVEGSGATVARPCAGEGEHESRPGRAGEPGGEAVLEHRDLVLRVQAAAVNDQNTAPAALVGVGQKHVDGRACFLCRHAVQVEVRLVSELAVAQATDEAMIDAHRRSLDELGGVGDVERPASRNQVRQLGDDLRIGVDHRTGGGCGWRNGNSSPRLGR